MAAKDNNSLVIWLSIFVLFSLGFGVAWYMTWSHSDDLRRQLATATDAETKSKGAITELNGQIAALSGSIGRAGTPDEIVETVKTEIAANAGNGAAVPPSLGDALLKAATDRDINVLGNNDKNSQLQAKTVELANLVATHAAAMDSMKKSLDEKEAALRQKERESDEQLAKLQSELDKTTAELREAQDNLETLRTETSNTIADLTQERDRQREALIDLRRDKQRLEGITYERPDGALTFVDQNALTCYVDIGSRDELRVGTTFSVYKKQNAGVGRAQSDKDIKGKIEITDILGDRLAKANIVDQRDDAPLGSGDPIYSPLFWPGQKLQIAVVGMLNFDGNPGSDREEFHRIVKGTGAEIVVEVNDEANILGKTGEVLDPAEIKNRITSQTRFLIVGDLGDTSTQDAAQREILNKIADYKEEMERAAENSGVYVLNLASFLDYVGYSSKSLTYSPTKRFPGSLANGALSRGVNATRGNRESSAAISGAFSTRRQKPLVSTGATSKLYSGEQVE